MKNTIAKLLSFTLSITIIIASIYTSISNSLNRDIIKTNIKNNLLSGFIYDDNGNLTDIFKTILKLTKLDEQTVTDLINNETANNILTDIVNSIYDYNLTGDESYKYTKEKIIDIVENNIDKVLNEINYNISPQDKEEVINYTKTHTDYIIDTIYSTNIGDYKK